MKDVSNGKLVRQHRECFLLSAAYEIGAQQFGLLSAWQKFAARLLDSAGPA